MQHDPACVTRDPIDLWRNRGAGRLERPDFAIVPRE